jgi:murein L,D-transpeptidase YcbB/YkuD
MESFLQRGRMAVGILVVSTAFLLAIFLLAIFLIPAGAQPLASCEQLSDSSLLASLGVRREICRLAQEGKLEDLRWPSFTAFRKQAREFYAAHEYDPVWTHQSQLTPQALALIELMEHAEQNGLRPDDYDGTRWTRRLARFAEKNPEITDNELASLDVSLTVSVLRYLTDLHRGRVNPNEVEFALVAKNFAAADFLRDRVVNATDAKAAVQQAEPAYSGYRSALQALHFYLELAKHGDGGPLPALSKPMAPGEAYAGTPQLAARLKQLGDLPVDATLPEMPGLYEGGLVQAVRHFQQRHGLSVTGHIGPETFQQLTVPLSHRVRELQLTLERWRWLPEDIGPSLIAINVPEFRLRAYEDHKEQLSMRVIVGQSFDHQTPIFADDMEFVIFRPYWNVPVSIIQNEIVPAMRRNPRYLATHHMEAVNRHGDVVTGPQVARQLKAGQLELRQQPGPGNSLGLLKFILPNQYSVYLHGTPEGRLFQRSRRDFSHGCIRVEDPAALAEWVLRNNPGWNLKRIRAAMRGSGALQVNLKRPIPVLVLYETVFVGEDGEVNFFDDIYGLDAALEQALDRPHP